MGFDSAGTPSTSYGEPVTSSLQISELNCRIGENRDPWDSQIIVARTWDEVSYS